MTAMMMSGKTRNNNSTKPIKVVIFGPDNSGKTTLAKKLTEDGVFLYSHSPGPIPIEGMCKYIEHYLDNVRNVVFDRFPVVEEMVCGKILRGTDKFDSFREEANSFLNRIDLFIFCNPGIEAITNWGTREQMEGIKENILNLHQGYCELFEKLKQNGKNVLVYNWQESEEKNKKVIERIKTL